MFLEAKMAAKWVPTTNLAMLRRMGKTIEELSELSSVCARCIIQGIDEVDPATGKTNRQRLTEEIADVYAQLDEDCIALNLPLVFIDDRRERKRGYMREWESMFDEPKRRPNMPEGQFSWRGKLYWSDPTGREETQVLEDGCWRKMTDEEHTALNSRDRKEPL